MAGIYNPDGSLNVGTIQVGAVATPLPIQANYGLPLLKNSIQSFTRPANTTAYVAGSLVANSTTAGSVVPLTFTGVTNTGNAGQGTVEKIIVYKSGTGAASLRLHLFSQLPAIGSGDGTAILVSDLSYYSGFVDIQLDDTINGGRVGTTVISFPYITPSGDTIYGLIEAYGGYTPASAETYTVRLQVCPTT